jgi:hypothetical protein
MACVALALLGAKSQALAETFRFVAIGDVPYTSPVQLDRLIERINPLDSRFTIHVGDIKSGSTLCNDETFESVKRQFMSFEKPLIYTPGDNEWTDCHRANNGPYDPLERLQKLRQLFFATELSLGRHPVELDSQSQSETFRQFSENRRWYTKEVSFATLHLVGSNNNLQPDLPSSIEFGHRNEATIAWMRSTFAEARKRGHRAVVFAMQADTFYHDPRIRESGFALWLEAFRQEAVAWGKPVLLIQGDTHQFVTDRPFANTHPAASNVLRMVVPGEHVADAVVIDVDTMNVAEPFSIQRLHR